MNKSKKIVLSTVAVMLMMTGCSSTPDPLYNFEDYTEEYYAYKKDPSADNLKDFKETIEEAIEDKDDGTSNRVAPTLYANLGYIALKAAKYDEAISFFNKEKETYPESSVLMDRMINKILEIKKGENNAK